MSTADDMRIKQQADMQIQTSPAIDERLRGMIGIA